MFDQMAAPVVVTIDRQIECVERELKLRHRVYANRVFTKRMTQALADREMLRMTAVLDTLKKIRERGITFPT
jgi:hypothetical protein